MTHIDHNAIDHVAATRTPIQAVDGDANDERDDNDGGGDDDDDDDDDEADVSGCGVEFVVHAIVHHHLAMLQSLTPQQQCLGTFDAYDCSCMY